MKYCSILSENTQVSECEWGGALGVDGMSPSVSRGEIRRQNNLRPLPLCTQLVIPSFCWYLIPWFGFSGQALTLQFSTRMIKEEMKNVYKGYFWDSLFYLERHDIIAEIWITNSTVPRPITCLYRAAITCCHQTSSQFLKIGDLQKEVCNRSCDAMSSPKFD